MQGTVSVADALARNRGLISETEQRLLAESTILIAGLGGVGGRTAETLARLGVGRLILADPDDFEVSNLNRQAACTTEVLGHNKASAVAALCTAVSPAIEVEVYSDGVTPENAGELVAGADVVIDGTDYTLPSLGVRLARESRARGIPVLIAVEVGFGGWYTSISPDGMTFERFFGLPRDVSLDDLDDGTIEIPLWRWVARMPPDVPLGVLSEIDAGTLDAPAVAPAVELTAAQLSTATLDLIAGRQVVEAPRIWHLDMREGRSRTFRPRYARFAVQAARLALGERLRRQGE